MLIVEPTSALKMFTKLYINVVECVQVSLIVSDAIKIRLARIAKEHHRVVMRLFP